MASALASQMAALAAARRDGDSAAPLALAGGALAAAPAGKASLLYSAREAADLDLEAIYAVGAAGEPRPLRPSTCTYMLLQDQRGGSSWERKINACWCKEMPGCTL